MLHSSSNSFNIPYTLLVHLPSWVLQTVSSGCVCPHGNLSILNKSHRFAPPNTNLRSACFLHLSYTFSYITQDQPLSNASSQPSQKHPQIQLVLFHSTPLPIPSSIPSPSWCHIFTFWRRQCWNSLSLTILPPSFLPVQLLQHSVSSATAGRVLHSQYLPLVLAIWSPEISVWEMIR